MVATNSIPVADSSVCSDLDDSSVKAVTESFAMSLRYRAWRLVVEGKYSEAESCLRRAVAICESLYGPEDPKVVASLMVLADLYLRWGKSQQTPMGTFGSRSNQAEPLYLRVIHIALGTDSLDHYVTGIALNNLARLYEDQGRFPLARSFFRSALAVMEFNLGLDHPMTLGIRHSLEKLNAVN